MIRTHKLGNSDLDVSVLGLGCMGMSEFYGTADETESVRVLHRALELGMKVVGYDPAISVEAAWRLSSQVQKVESLQELLAISDFVTLHVPAIKQTHHMISTTAIPRTSWPTSSPPCTR